MGLCRPRYAVAAAVHRRLCRAEQSRALAVWTLSKRLLTE